MNNIFSYLVTAGGKVKTFFISGWDKLKAFFTNRWVQGGLVVLGLILALGCWYIGGMFNNSFYQNEMDRHAVILDEGGETFMGIPAQHHQVNAIGGDEILDFVILNHQFKNPDLVILQFRGNWGPLTHRYRDEKGQEIKDKGENLGQLVKFLKEIEQIRQKDENAPHARKITMIGFDPPGYGGSTGEPTLESVERAAHTALKFKETHYPGIDTYVVCHSLGGNIFLQAYTNPKLTLGYPHDIRGVILDSTFASYREVGGVNASRVHPLLGYLVKVPGVKAVLTGRGIEQHVEDASAMYKIEKFLQYKIPLLVLHDLHDPTVPYSVSLSKYMIDNDIARNNDHITFHEDDSGNHIGFFATEEFRRAAFEFFLKYKQERRE